MEAHCPEFSIGVWNEKRFKTTHFQKFLCIVDCLYIPLHSHTHTHTHTHIGGREERVREVGAKKQTFRENV